MNDLFMYRLGQKRGGGGSGGGGGAPSVAPKDINFYDYDGTRVASWSLAELAGKSELPAMPEHKGLVAQEWNWSLEDLKAENAPMDVGANYITDDGATRLYITIETDGRMTVPICFYQSVANGVTVDWGDGSVTETFSNYGGTTISPKHTYAKPGDYVISLLPLDGCTIELSGGSSYCVMGSHNSNNAAYTNMLKKVEIGLGVTTFPSYVFKSCYSLTALSVPSDVKTISNDAFVNCYSLVHVSVPSGVRTIPSYAFQSCYGLDSVSMPTSVTSVDTCAFYGCSSLRRINFSPNVKSIATSALSGCTSLANVNFSDNLQTIGKQAFSVCSSLATVNVPSSVYMIIEKAFESCASVALYDFSQHTSVPNLTAANAFSSIPSDCQIRVPAALVDEWKAATNWSTYADYIVGV